MNQFKSITGRTASNFIRLPNGYHQLADYKPLMWLMALMLAALVAGCGGGGGGGGDTTAPTVTFNAPANAATGIALNTSVNAIFSEAMNPSTITSTTFTLKLGTALVPGSVGYSGVTAVFHPTANLASSTIYTATVTTGVTDLDGNALAVAKTWSFTTGATTDTTPPTVLSTVPVNLATGVALNTNVNAIFSKPMDPSTITSTTFTLKHLTTPVPGAVTYMGTTAIFNPTSNLAASTTYTATVTTGVTDLAGNVLATNSTWNFTTGAVVAAGPKPVVLGGAGNFVILTKTGITNVPTSAIVGNIGSSPITAFAMNTVTCTEITGFIYGVDAAYTGSGTCFKPGTTGGSPNADKTLVDNAVLDMMTAYTDAAGRTLPDHTELGGGNVSGMTLAPGLYKWGTGVLITNAGVTLSGGPNDVWIFQIAQDLTVNNAAIVHLIGGALAKNIFWQVGGGVGVTIGTTATAHMEGVILAAKAITLGTGATGNVRLLAQTDVTLQQNVVTQPAP